MNKSPEKFESLTNRPNLSKKCQINPRIAALVIALNGILLSACVEEEGPVEQGPTFIMDVSDCPDEISHELCNKETGELDSIYCGEEPYKFLCFDDTVMVCDDPEYVLDTEICENYCYMGNGQWTMRGSAEASEDACTTLTAPIVCWDEGELHDCQ